MSDLSATAAPRAPEFWEPWQPQVGDRVRIRLSGECRIMFGLYALDENLQIIARRSEPVGHTDEEDGRLGVVIKVIGPSGPIMGYRLTESSHRFLVDYDQPIAHLSRYGCAYAALELEPLEVPS